MEIKQYDVLLISLDPTVGHEIKKSRPCVILSPDEMNKHISTVIIAPMTSQSHPYPTRVHLTFRGKSGWIVLDQIRTVDKRRLIKNLGKIDRSTINSIKSVIKELLVD
ncbi:MAG: type II toxin-antitoxin system PemK/MazF family toxin [Candidatus Omnitrophica bacterium]|nr:type II toxin-antitoxin system PemK/MazF family toxin [Candidatus Omnitrophota bacterium]MBU1523304.1 type II toxin-antitoxin system PemK/MazF family toxin [Candidatus Omnitrophota bacterium]